MSGASHVPKETITPQEWMRRFADRIMEVQKWPERVAMEYAQESFMDFHEMAELYRDCPEDAADEDMSSWDDDDGGDDE